MFQNLSDRLSKALDALKRKGTLSEQDVNQALREIRVALLEADVALPVVKEFIETVRTKAVGEEVIRSVSPAQMVIKIVHDTLIATLGAETPELKCANKYPDVYLMVGLQGAGKTTFCGKLTRYLTKKLNKKVLLCSVDVYRPAALKQLQTLAQTLDTPIYPTQPEDKPLEVVQAALKQAKKEAYDILILDTAGRLHIDLSMMEEIQSIHALTTPVETFLVADAMTGQDAATIAKQFSEHLDISGIVLTRMDGDARGGAALSMRHITQAPIKFMGTGEKIEDLEIFNPKRLADRILGMGDIVSLVEKASESMETEDAEALNHQLEKGSFDLSDLMKQLQQMQKMGGIKSLLANLPGLKTMTAKMPTTEMDESMLKRQIAIIQSMTPKERKYIKLLNASRKRRISQGSGTSVPEINKLLKMHEGMVKLMKKMKKNQNNPNFLRQMQSAIKNQ